jgi:hypothetical protein
VWGWLYSYYYLKKKKKCNLTVCPSLFAARLQRTLQIVAEERRGSESKLVTGGLCQSVAVNIFITQSSILILSFQLHALQLSNLPPSVDASVVPSTYCRRTVLLCCYLLRGDECWTIGKVRIAAQTACAVELQL